MPIIVQTPPTGGPFGPGMTAFVQTNIVGPVATPSWRIDLFDAGNELSAFQATFTVSDPHNLGGLTYTPQTSDHTYLSRSEWGQGLNGNLRIQLVSGSSVVEEITVPVIIDNTTGEVNRILADMRLYWQALNSSINGINGNTNAQISAVLAGQTTLQGDVTSILTSVLGGIPGFTGQIINNIIGQPAPGLVTRELIGDFTDCGALTRVAFGQPVDAFGLAWEVISLGGGVGIDASVPQRFEPWLIDIEQRHVDHSGHEYTSATARFDYSNGYWFFQPSLPSLVNYCILPSVTLRLYWLLVTI